MGAMKSKTKYRVYYMAYIQHGYMGEWAYRNYIDELSSVGWDFKIRTVPYDKSFDCFNIIKKDLEDEDYDIFITACDDVVLDGLLLSLFDSKSIPKVLICFDNLSVPHKHKQCAKYFDLVWLTSVETQYLFERWGAKTLFMPYAANPILYQPIKGNEFGGVSFVGSIYGVRRKKLSILSRSGVEVDAFGGNQTGIMQTPPLVNALSNIENSTKNMMHLLQFNIGRKSLAGAFLKSLIGDSGEEDKNIRFHRSKNITFERLSSIYSRSKISLGVTELWNTYMLRNPVHKIHLRCFEIPMSGGLQLVSRSEEFMDYFKEDKEVIFYDDDQELVDKAKYYLISVSTSKREKMKENARIRSLKEHTWSNRFYQLVKALGV